MPVKLAYDYIALAKDVRVVDGDTLEMDMSAREVDIGFGVTVVGRVKAKLRLAGMDAKPLKTPEGDKAAAWLRSYVAGRALMVTTVKNGLGEDKHEKYGRYLAIVNACEADGSFLVPSLNEAMVAAGMATPWDGKGPHPE